MKHRQKVAWVTLSSRLGNMAASRIQVLPREVVRLIAAGEVIDSLAAVVRELAENSLDAGATRIVVHLYPQEWRVRVADNGVGMSYEDLLAATQSHSTSKIQSCVDLQHIQSLGFRGEALHSLAALADLEILSRCSVPHHNDTPVRANPSCGWGAKYGRDGQLLKIETVAIAPGTVVTVSNLFANYPARRQGMPSLCQQLKAVTTTIQQIALSHPQVAWQVWQNDRIWLKIAPGATIGSLLPQFISQVRSQDLQELTIPVAQLPDSDHQEQATIHLAIGLPDRCHRHRPDWVRIAINRRFIKSSELEQTIFSAFHRTLPRDRYPICIIHLLVPPHHIDWNRNPAKSEIYLKHLGFWQSQITYAINQALNLHTDTSCASNHTTRISKILKAAEATNPYHSHRSIPHTPSEPASGDIHRQRLKAVAQINHMYIVAEHPGGMWLIEQHIAHERVLYEQICDHWQIVPVEPPIILYQLSEKQVLQLQHIGLDIEPFGEQLWAVRSIPAMLKGRDDSNDAILELSLGGDLQAAQVAVACRSAIRNGTPLSLPQMQNLLDDWQKTRNPHTCPHGRPIYLSLEEPALARFFRRHWVIGKSHGI
ncbi:DNA mismatch repair protein [Calothrix sp. NIES-3974]|nr:DNA mismatch repair protein [Calothrix sp. NIES-3974]